MRIINQSSYPEVFAVKHKDIKVRMESRSGGIFTALSDYILLKNGVVYGCVLDKEFLPHHVRTKTREIRNEMRGSKYVQSSIGETYKQVRIDLKNNKLVLFSGTSCQISGLLSYISDLKVDNLFCIDIVCHGVPSRKVWTDYLLWQEKKMKKKCSSVDFRNKKKYGWASHIETISFGAINYDSKVFTTLFYEHSILRPSCYNCPYKDVTHPGDITIADYWGIDDIFPDFNDNKGVSLVLINNDKGKDLFNGVSKDIDYRKSQIENSMQPPLKNPFPEPNNRKEFWSDYINNDFSFIVKRYTHKSLIKRIVRKLLN